MRRSRHTSCYVILHARLMKGPLSEVEHSDTLVIDIRGPDCVGGGRHWSMKSLTYDQYTDRLCVLAINHISISE